METASETVARVKAQMAASGTDPAAPTTAAPASNPLIDILTSRLTDQGKGISSSSSSTLQQSITDAIASTKASGDATRARLLSEQTREVGAAKDVAYSDNLAYLTSQGGYALQTAALRTLTDSTEKSVRDLDGRYREALLANDATTAKSISDLIVKKAEFQQTQEQNYYQNLFALGNLQEQAISRAQQSEQFWTKQREDHNQFVANLDNSKYQFEQNYGLQLRDLGLKEQQIGLQRQQNNISYLQYKAQMQKIQEDKANTTISAQIYTDLRREVTDNGKTAADIDPDAYASWAYGHYGAAASGISFEQISAIAGGVKTSLITNKVAPANLGRGASAGDPSTWDFGTVSDWWNSSNPDNINWSNNANANKILQGHLNDRKAATDKANGVTIQSPESYWANYFK